MLCLNAKRYVCGWLIAVLMGYGHCVAQEYKLSLHSLSLAPGISFSPSNKYDIGPNVSMDVATMFRKHILSLYLSAGGEVHVFLDDRVNDYHEVNVAYGREYNLAKWLLLESHVGLGYINYVQVNLETDFNRNTHRSLGIPFRFKFFFKEGNHFNMGINLNVNINSFATMYSSNLLFQYKFF